MPLSLPLAPMARVMSARVVCLALLCLTQVASTPASDDNVVLHVGTPDRVTVIAAHVAWPAGARIALDGALHIADGGILEVGAGAVIEAAAGVSIVVD
ncbi:MAG: hypothetical protein H7Z40_11480, partial [Phycisphaerae bacterium]|nr:hypothetical protein [Gemmatimonadaceae bacterium]